MTDRLDKGRGAVMTHAELVARAEAWLRGTMRCGVVLTERQGRFGEMPDAIGWWPSGASAMVECKASRGDFFADLKKPWRLTDDSGMGRYRWYLAPAGMLRVEEVPEGFGFLEAHPRHIAVGRQAPRRDGHAQQGEIHLLVSELRRYQLHGITYPPLELPTPPAQETDPR